jgi:hypothetical protein
MGPENSEEADFLARQPTWVRKILQGDYALSPEESAEMQQANWPEVFGVAQDQYRVLLKRHPEKLREYRKLQKRLGAASGLWGVPSVPSGAPRQDALAREARGLEQAGLSLIPNSGLIEFQIPEPQRPQREQETLHCGINTQTAGSKTRPFAGQNLVCNMSASSAGHNHTP